MQDIPGNGLKSIGKNIIKFIMTAKKDWNKWFEELQQQFGNPCYVLIKLDFNQVRLLSASAHLAYMRLTDECRNEDYLG